MLRSEPVPTSPLPVANGLSTVRELLPVFQSWLSSQRDETQALILLRALTSESLVAAKYSDEAQMEFSALDLVQACGWSDISDFDAASTKVKNAKLEKYVLSRTNDLEAFFQQQGFSCAVKVGKRSPSGRHRAVWFLDQYELPTPAEVIEIAPAPEPAATGWYPDDGSIEYQYAAAGTVQPSWVARLLFGRGWFATRSVRGVLFLCIGLAPMFIVAGLVMLAWLVMSVRRPVTTADLSFLAVSASVGWVLWLGVRSLWWLLADRIIPASEILVRWSDDAAQVESFKEGTSRLIGLVRYSAICPVCAAAIELRYGEGAERRRLLGCCVEAPQEHVFTFDRVTRRGRRIR